MAKEKKTEKLAFRLPARLRFGLGLLAKKYRSSESEAISRCIETALEHEGWTQRAEGEMWSPFDSVWMANEGPARSLAIAAILPELASEDDKRLVEAYTKVKKHMSGQGEGIGAFDNLIIEAIAQYIRDAPGGLSPGEYDDGLYKAYTRALERVALEECAHPPTIVEGIPDVPHWAEEEEK